MIAKVFMNRILRDTNSIAKVAVRAAGRISGKIRARYMEEFRTGHKFKAREYLIQQYKPILVSTYLASHLAGFRRVLLMLKQTPALKRKFQELIDENNVEEIALELSELSDALSILQKKTFLNIEELQRKYDTQALKILADVSGDIEESLEGEFKSLIEEGVSVNTAIQRLGAKFDELGLSPRKPHQIETVFRTQLQMSFAAGRYQAENHPDVAEILWGYTYSTVGDDRVRDEHAILEGTTLPKDDPFWQRFYPPNGWNCRCSAIPIFEQRKIVLPPTLNEVGNVIAPDRGFDFNPGVVFRG